MTPVHVAGTHQSVKIVQVLLPPCSLLTQVSDTFLLSNGPFSHSIIGFLAGRQISDICYSFANNTKILSQTNIW